MEQKVERLSHGILQLSKIDVTGGTGNATTTSPTPAGGQPTGQTDLLIYGGVGAAVVIIAILIVFLMMRKSANTAQIKD